MERRRRAPGGTATIILLLLGSPIAGLQFGLPDHRVLPAHATSRMVEDQKLAGFPAEETDAIQVVAPTVQNPSSATGDITDYAAKLSRIPGIVQVDSFAGSYAEGRLITPPNGTYARFAGADGGTFLTVIPYAASINADAPKLVGEVRATDAPFDVMVGGSPADLIDFREALLGKIPVDLEESVANGIQKSGLLVTTAAAILAFTFAAYAAGEVVFLKMLGVGMTLAVLVDATLIRSVLVPALMKLAGHANWWAPPALRPRSAASMSATAFRRADRHREPPARTGQGRRPS
ncbi:MMPL family transporter [Paenibacillus allorhizosphaerae]|nr:MMPL family transporter [Paenibacillus allorhizosphaerae]